MKKLVIMLMAAGAVTFSSCNEDRGTSTETNENDSNTPDSASGTDSSATSYNSDAQYRNRANRMSQQVAQDLRLDTATQTRIQTVYYNRARQMDELETRFSSTNRSGGMAADSADMSHERLMNGNMDMSGTEATSSPVYLSEMEKINDNTETELRGFLSSEQFNLYNANRKKYYAQDMEYKLKSSTGSKMKMEDADTKSDDMKLKRAGDEMKIKADNTKIKIEN